MKKLLGLTLALAMILPSGQASAELLKNFKLSGQLDLQSQASRNVADFITRQDQFPVNGALGSRPSFNDRLNGAQTRLLLGMDWDVLDDVHARVSLAKRTRQWGTTGAGVGIGGGTAQNLTADGAGTVLGSVFVSEANVKIDKVFGALDATLGRQYYGTSGDLIIYYGPSDKALYGMPVTALDAAKVDWNSDMLSLTALAGKQVGSALGATAQTAGTGVVGGNDVDVRGLNIGVKGIEGVAVNVYAWNRMTHGNGALGFDQDARNDNLYVYGAKAKVNMGGLTAGLEFAKNSGESRDVTGLMNTAAGDATGDGVVNAMDKVRSANYTGWAWKADAAYKLDIEDVASFTPWFEMGWGTGRGSLIESDNEGFQAIASDYRPGAIYGRFSANSALPLGSGIPCVGTATGCSSIGASNGVLSGTNVTGVAGGVTSNGLNNRVIWGFGAKFTPAMANQLTAALSFWSFSFQRITNDGREIALPNAFHNGAPKDTYGEGRGARHIGSELDFDLTWKHSDNVTFGTGVASFKPGKYIQELIRDQANSPAITTGSRVSYNSAVLAYGDVRVKF